MLIQDMLYVYRCIQKDRRSTLMKLIIQHLNRVYQLNIMASF